MLTETVRKGKNLTSIASKILVQICAKVGGCPWSLKSIPSADQPTMIWGLDIYHNKGHSPYIAFVASCDSFSSSVYPMNGRQGGALKSDSLKRWSSRQPGGDINCWDRSNRSCLLSCQYAIQVRLHLPEQGHYDPWFHPWERKLDSPPQVWSLSRTLSDDPVKQEFYLISQAVKRGVPLPTKYVIIASTLDQTLKDI